MRSVFFGEDASTRWRLDCLLRELGRNYRHEEIDIRDRGEVDRIFKYFGDNIAGVIHTAAQPSHDWAANDPYTDFTVNANGTLNLLEATRKYAPEVAFISYNFV